MECGDCGSVTYDYKNFSQCEGMLRPVIYGLSTYLFSQVALSSHFQITATTGSVVSAVVIGAAHGLQTIQLDQNQLDLSKRVGIVALSLPIVALTSGILTAASRRSFAFRPFVESALVGIGSPLVYWGIGQGINGAHYLWPDYNELKECAICRAKWDSNSKTANKIYLATLFSGLLAGYSLFKLANGVIRGYKLNLSQNVPLKVWMSGTLSCLPSTFSFAERIREGNSPKKTWGWSDVIGLTLSSLGITFASRYSGAALSRKQVALLGGVTYVSTMMTYVGLDRLIKETYEKWPQFKKKSRPSSW